MRIGGNGRAKATPLVGHSLRYRPSACNSRRSMTRSAALSRSIRVVTSPTAVSGWMTGPCSFVRPSDLLMRYPLLCTGDIVIDQTVFATSMRALDHEATHAVVYITSHWSGSAGRALWPFANVFQIHEAIQFRFLFGRQTALLLLSNQFGNALLGLRGRMVIDNGLWRGAGSNEIDDLQVRRNRGVAELSAEPTAAR
jgi:hypothetical protein